MVWGLDGFEFIPEVICLGGIHYIPNPSMTYWLIRFYYEINYILSVIPSSDGTIT